MIVDLIKMRFCEHSAVYRIFVHTEIAHARRNNISEYIFISIGIYELTKQALLSSYTV